MVRGQCHEGHDNQETGIVIAMDCFEDAEIHIEGIDNYTCMTDTDKMLSKALYPALAYLIYSNDKGLPVTSMLAECGRGSIFASISGNL